MAARTIVRVYIVLYYMSSHLAYSLQPKGFTGIICENLVSIRSSVIVVNIDTLLGVLSMCLETIGGSVVSVLKNTQPAPSIMGGR